MFCPRLVFGAAAFFRTQVAPIAMPRAGPSRTSKSKRHWKNGWIVHCSRCFAADVPRHGETRRERRQRVWQAARESYHRPGFAESVRRAAVIDNKRRALRMELAPRHQQVSQDLSHTQNAAELPDEIVARCSTVPAHRSTLARAAASQDGPPGIGPWGAGDKTWPYAAERLTKAMQALEAEAGCSFVQLGAKHFVEESRQALGVGDGSASSQHYKLH